MKIYFAGSAATKEREEIWLNRGIKNRLISYYIHITNELLNKDTEVIFKRINRANNKHK